jgi:catechol 2,3-dioxygenase-like lactoylglutathione lyase family enzyme
MANPAIEIHSNVATSDSVAKVNMKLEVVVIPVSDIDRAKEFYKKLGWRLDVTPPSVVQFTPPGSWCSVQFGTTLTTAAPGSAKSYLIVPDIVAARRTGPTGTPSTWCASRMAKSCRNERHVLTRN